jgi:hypothetical protein
MPRLDHIEYSNRRTLLGILWCDHDPAFCRLSPGEQRDLHTYFAPLRELDVAQLKALRLSVTKLDASLPQRAGQAWVKLQRLMPVAPMHTRHRRTKHKGQPVAHGVLRPEPDYDKFIRALRRHIGDEK